MPKSLLTAAGMVAAFAGLGLPSPATAQGRQNVLVVYGNDPCPTTKSGDEIVVCARKPESDRYRIPENLRGSTAPPSDRWSERAKSLASVGASGTGSCSATGGGGWTGCWAQGMNQARDERKAEAEGTTNNGNSGVTALVKGNQNQ